MMRGTLPVLILAIAAGCGPARVGPLPVLPQLPPPEAADVERVVYLIGDTGYNLPMHRPVFALLKADIEAWAARLDTAAVTLLVLGDLIYPKGMHDATHPDFPTDSAILDQQIDLVRGPAASGREARAYFMAGNHDYGQDAHLAGRLRLENAQTFIERARRRGAAAWFLPGLHELGPTVVDLGDRVRILILDTAWWLLQSNPQEKLRMLVRMDAAMASAGDRQVIVAAHHPFTSAGPHGGFVSLWDALGFRFILARSGAILQDLNSVPYDQLRDEIRAIFQRRGRPLIFVGGHEHSLQLIRHAEDDGGAPHWSLVSGAGSKVSEVGRTAGMQAGAGQLGYMKVVFRHDGHVDLYAEAVPVAYNECPAEPEALATCMAEALAAAETVFSMRLR